MIETIRKNVQKSQDSNQNPNYQIIRKIGSGSFGYVFEAIDPVHKRRVAIKRVEKVGNQVSREYEVLKAIQDCDYVVKILDFFYTRTEEKKLIQNTVFEYIDSNLESLIQEYLKKKQDIPLKEIKTIIYQVLSGLEYIHRLNISHRDLKPENILYNKDGRVKICDFGSSKQLDPEIKNTPYIVSRYYRAPELILCITQYTVAIDIWALGCILFELVTLNILFKGKTEGDQLNQILRKMGTPDEQTMRFLKSQVPFEGNIFENFKGYQKVDLNEEFQGCDNLNKKVLKQNQDKQLLIDLLENMLIYNPNKRINAQEALKHSFFEEIRHLFQ